MKGYSFRKSQAPNSLPYVLLGGLLIGIVIYWILFEQPPSSFPPSPSETPVYHATSTLYSTPIPRNVVEITPQASVQSIAAIGKPAPDFTLKTIDGNEIRLSNLKGKPVLINLWASWCPPCRYEMPDIQAAYEKYKAKELVVLGIDFTAQDDLKDVAAFVKELKLTFPILLDVTGEVSTGLYGMRGLPTSYFIDPEGVIRRIQIGAMLPDKLEGYLAEILPK